MVGTALAHSPLNETPDFVSNMILPPRLSGAIAFSRHAIAPLVRDGCSLFIGVSEMTQNDLNRAVAKVTGETVTEISHRGFQPIQEPVEDDSETDRVDWDRLEAQRNVPLTRRQFPAPQMA
jgi:hypothetical protein